MNAMNSRSFHSQELITMSSRKHTACAALAATATSLMLLLVDLLFRATPHV
jgi:hypothetical protein